MAYAPPPMPVAALVDRHAGQPRSERPISVILSQVLKGGHEAFLSEVKRFFGVADMRADQAIDRPLVPSHDLSEGGQPSAERQGGELAVRAGREIKAHRASAVSAFATARSNAVV